MSRYTWKELAVHFPEFVQWIVQRYGGVPEGPIKREDYLRFQTEYITRSTGTDAG